MNSLDVKTELGRNTSTTRQQSALTSVFWFCSSGRIKSRLHICTAVNKSNTQSQYLLNITYCPPLITAADKASGAETPDLLKRLFYNHSLWIKHWVWFEFLRGNSDRRCQWSLLELFLSINSCILTLYVCGRRGTGGRRWTKRKNPKCIHKKNTTETLPNPWCMQICISVMFSRKICWLFSE